MDYYTYILYSQQIDRYYVGYTGDSLEERLRKHNTNHKGYTGRTNDWVVVYKKKYRSKSEAYELERHIKRQKSRTYIESLIHSTE